MKIGSLFHIKIVSMKLERFSRVKSQLGQFPKLLLSDRKLCRCRLCDIGEAGAGVYSKLLSAAPH